MFKYQVSAVCWGTNSMESLGSYSSMSNALAKVKSLGIRLDSVPITLIDGGLEIFPSGNKSIQIRKVLIKAA